MILLPLFSCKKGGSAVQWYFPLFTLAFLAAACAEIIFELQIYQWAILLCLMIALLGCLVAKRVQKAKYILCAVLGCGIGLIYIHLFTGLVHTPINALDQTEAEVYATVTGYADRYEDTQRVTIKVDTKASGLNVWMPSFSTMAYVPLTEEELSPGDQIQGHFSFYQGSSNGGFDRAAYYAGQNFHILASCTWGFSVEKPDQIPWTLKPLIWAHGFQEKLDAFLNPRSASFMKALLFGEKSDLTMHDRQSFQKSGLSHVMAVSGMHVGFLVAFFILMIGRRFGLMLSLVAIAVFIPMAGASPSVIRAAIMYAFAAVGFFMRWENSTLHSLCAALMMLLIYNPYAINSLSLQLSFLATLGLIVFSSRIQGALVRPFREKLHRKWSKKTAYAITGALSCSISAMIFTVPVLFSAFGYVSAASVLANILTLGVFSITFICGFLLCFFGWIPVIGTVLSACIHGLCVYIFWITDTIGAITPLLLYWDTWFVKAAAGILYLLIIGKIIAKKRFPTQVLAASCCAVLIATLYANARYVDHRKEVTLFSAGSGQSIAVSAGLDDFALIDCAGSGYQNAAEDVLSYMDWFGCTDIDLLILTALDRTHARNIPQLLENVPVRQIVIPDNTQKSELGDHILHLAQTHHIPVTIWRAAEERMVGMESLGISLIGGTAWKLGVRIQNGNSADLLTLHSFTPKMTEALLENDELTCERLIVSEQYLKNENELHDLLIQLSAKELLLPSGWYESGKIGEISMRSTKTEGDIAEITRTDWRRGKWQ